MYDTVEGVRSEPAVLQREMCDVGQYHQVFQSRVDDLAVLSQEWSWQDMFVPLASPACQVAATEPLEMEVLDVLPLSNVIAKQEDNLWDSICWIHLFVFDDHPRLFERSPIRHDPQRNLLQHGEAVPEVVTAQNIEMQTWYACDIELPEIFEGGRII